eukprot:CAMPEP_0194535128 /NCGR_PEP_ID=MMETSP0253-20130528/73564_1 /TAXON_ID=2966 /ORGANISM="Noctiluca scintillans" /LENGTH=278 /DNA_ID=CAMNT_0039380865 /DNA_START=95 /DNA_END=928 /DNA_ORIENTATION=+
MKPLLEWLEGRGARVDGVVVQRSKAGRRLVASRPLPAGFTFFRAPAECILSGAACLASPIGEALCQKFRLHRDDEESDGEKEDAVACDEDTPVVTPLDVLYAFLVAASDDDEHFGPFVTHLRGCGGCTPHFWSPADRARLPLDVGQELQREEAAVCGQYHVLFPALTEAFPDLFPASCSTESRWKLAHDLFRSRAFLAKPGTQERNDASEVFVPLLDCMNHDSEAANVEWLGTGLGDDVGARVTRPVLEGEELLYSYGCKGNSKLSLSYGFALWENPH